MTFGRLAAATLATALWGAGCGDPCCDTDTFPVPLARGPTGELLVGLGDSSGSGQGVLDTGSPLTFWAAPDPSAAARVVERDVRLLGVAPSGGTPPLRALFRGVNTIETRLGAVGTPDAPLAPAGVLGGDLLSGFAVEVGFAAPELVFRTRQTASDAFLAQAGFAVVHVPRRGGGQLTLLDPEDSLGQRAHHSYPPSRLVAYACAAPSVFHREDPLPPACCPGRERVLSSGTDLALLIATGVGPVVLGRAAWQRVQANLPAGDQVALTSRSLQLPSVPDPIPASWTRLPRLALVDQQADLATNPGPCGELARARRLEQVELAESSDPASTVCPLPCDRNPRDGSQAQTSAAYLELDDMLDVAIVDDEVPFLQAIRAEVRPRGPEVDGLLGAAALAHARVELDYVNSTARAIFSCEGGEAGDAGSTSVPCRAAPSCAPLTDHTHPHSCFGLPAHTLPQMCENQPTCAD